MGRHFPGPDTLGSVACGDSIGCDGVIGCVGSFFFLLLLENIVFLDTKDDEVKVDGLAADLATAVS